MMHEKHPLDVGDVSRRSGLPVSTLHVWEQRGLLTPIGREGLRRQYDPAVLERIATIILFQRGGFTLAEIAGFLSGAIASETKERLAGKLGELRKRRHELDVAITGIEHALACAEPSPIECPAFRSMLDGVLPITRR